MTFLAPLFLFGALMVAVPLLLHLRRRKSKERLAFPSLMFLEEVPHATIRRRRLRDLLLLALRCAAITLLALAFAQPALRSSLGDGLEPRTDHFLLIDRSASMAGAERWQQAQQAVREYLARASANDTFTVGLFDDEVEVVALRETDPARISPLVGESSPRDRATSLEAGLRVLRPLIVDTANAGQATPRLLIVSDFRTNAIETLAGGSAEGVVPPGTAVELFDVSAQETAGVNHWVQSVQLEHRVGGQGAAGRERVVVSAQIAASRDPEVPAAAEDNGRESLRVQLLVDDRQVDERDIVSSDRVSSVVFDPVALDARRASRGLVRVVPSQVDQLAADDSFFFTASANDALTAVVVESGRGGSGVFVRRALESAASPRFAVRAVRARALGDSDLQNAHLAVVTDAGALSTTALTALERWVRSGGGLLVGYSRESVGKDLPAWIDFRSEGRPNQRRGGLRLVSVLEAHPIFAALAGAEWGASPFFRSYDLRPQNADGGADETVLAFFEDGSGAAVERRVDAGRVLGFASSLDTSWNEFPRRAAFLALIDQSARYLANFEPTRPHYSVGEPVLVADPVPGHPLSDLVLVSPSGAVERLGGEQPRADPEGNEPREGTELLFSFDESGFNAIRPSRSEQARWFAANLDRSESDQTKADLALLEARLQPSEPEQTSAAGLNPEFEPRSFWWLVLFALFLLLASEGLVASRGSRLLPAAKPSPRNSR